MNTIYGDMRWNYITLKPHIIISVSVTSYHWKQFLSPAIFWQFITVIQSIRELERTSCIYLSIYTIIPLTVANEVERKYCTLSDRSNIEIFGSSPIWVTDACLLSSSVMCSWVGRVLVRDWSVVQSFVPHA
jgi:hypothetical protein